MIGGKFTYRWLGSYAVKKINKNGSITLENYKGSILKKKYNAALLKPYIENTSGQEVDKTDVELQLCAMER